MLSLFLGALLGFCEFILLKLIVDSLLINRKSILLPLLGKLLLYAGFGALFLTLLRDSLLYAGIGLGAGMIIAAAVNAVMQNIKGSK